MEFRLADCKDTKKLAELRWEFKSSETTVDITQKESFINYCSDYLRMMFRENFYCWVAIEEDKIISHIYIIVVKKVPKPDKLDGEWGYVTAVYTIPEYQNQGIGKQLMDKVKDWSMNKGLELLIVWPSDRSIPFYKRSGFNEMNDILELSFE